MIHIITGGLGSGKSEKCIQEIEKIHSLYPNSKCLMLVNEHNSHETERRFNEYFGGTGLNNIEVTTFRKLARELLSGNQLRTMNVVGQQMILKKTIDEYMSTSPQINGNLRRAVCRDGFIDVLSQMIGEVKNYDVKIEAFRAAAKETADNKALNEKLTLMADMLEIYNHNFDALDYTDVQDIPTMLAEKIKETDYFDDTYLWIDKFDEILPQQMKVIEALYTKVKQLTASVSYPSIELEQPLYSEIERTLRKIEKLDSKIEYIDCGEHLKNIKSPDIKHLVENWLGSTKYQDDVKNIKLTVSDSAYNEIELVAGRIIDLVREDGYRFNDIAVICGNEAEYSYLVDTVFAEYKIPVFTDAKISLSNHPTAVQILSIFDIFENDFDYESVFEYLKAGFIYEEAGGIITEISKDDIDELENFVLKYGIRGRSRWFATRPWTTKNTISNITLDEIREKDEEEAQKINELRQKLVKPLKKYYKASEGDMSGQAHAEALFTLLDEINLYQGLNMEIKRFANSDRIDEADEFEQIWDQIIDVLDQLVISVGDTQMNRETFGKYIRAGISKCEITTIPSGIDKVYFGTAERNAPSDVRALFMIGASLGTFPNEMNNEGFFSNNDRDCIKDIVPLAPNTMGRMEKRRYNIFQTLCSATEKLYVSYSANDISSNAQSPSRIFGEIQSKFKDKAVPLENDVETIDNYSVYIASPEVTIHKLLKRKNTDNPVWDAVYSYYKEKEEYSDYINMIDNGRSIARQFTNIPSEDAINLYGDGMLEYSAAKLNTYAKCPYMFFMQYGLGIREREEWNIDPRDIGNYSHSIIERFCRIVEDGETDRERKSQKWKELSESKKNEILRDMFKTAEDKILESDITRRGKVMNIMKRMENVLIDAVDLVHSSLKHGNYTIVDEEKSFDVSLSEKVKLHGYIDRYDICETPEYTGIRIIDYKTGKTKFDINNIQDGVDMQLVLYASAIKKILSEKNPEKNYKITGIYYNHVDGEASKTEMTKKAKEKTLNKFDGVSFIESIDDFSALYDTDERLENDPNPEFLNIKLTKKYEINKIYLKSKKLATFEEGQQLMEDVENIALRFDDEIRNQGFIKQYPYDKTCDYCNYSKMCDMFGKKEKREKTKKEAE